MQIIQVVFGAVVMLMVFGARIRAVPLEATTISVSKVENEASVERAPAKENADSHDPDTASSQKETTYAVPDHKLPQAGGGQFEPAVYGSYLTPEAFQQYLSQFGTAFAPFSTAYPTPMGFLPPPPPSAAIYPGPYAIQTGYEGYLVPSRTSANTAASSDGHLPDILQGGIFATAGNYVSPVMSSSIFRGLIAVSVFALAVLIGGLMTTAVCYLTPICEISFKPVPNLRAVDDVADVVDVGRMVAEGMTPERVRRAADFVRNAVRTYQQMQTTMTGQQKKDN